MRNSVTVQINYNAQLFGKTNPIEIRNGRLKLVGTLRPGGTLELDDGIYEISAVLDDGRKHTQLLHLEAGAHEEVTLGVPVEMQPVLNPPPQRRRSFGVVGGVQTYRTPDAAQIEGPIQFVRSTGALLRSQRSTTAGEVTWVFEAQRKPVTVPRAHFSILGNDISISLPVNPEGVYPESTCDVVTIIRAGKPEVRAWISRERRLASTIQQMAVSGYLLRAAEIAGESTELLRDKYRDPTGALLGALLLNKIGQLESRRRWVENLARDFDWLEDAKVLLAMLFSKEEGRQDEAFLLATGAVQKRMMFTETYSLLLNLLRRWPGRTMESEARNSAGLLAAMAPRINWDSMMFYDSDY